MKRTKRIGIFDSGLGGLHILRSIVRTLPEYEYVYLGDTARTPYGNRSQETIYEFTRQAVEFLLAEDCEVIVLACNTASSRALRKIQQEYLPVHAPTQKVLGVLIPAAEEAATKSVRGRIGIIATQGTVESESFPNELTKLSKNIRVFQNACPLLVPLVEAGEQNSPEMETLLKKYLSPLLKKNIDTLILGCTHYGILEKKIRKIVGPKITIISEAGVVARKFRSYLKKHSEIEGALSKKAKVHFFSTDNSDSFERLGSKIMGKKIKAKKVTL